MALFYGTPTSRYIRWIESGSLIKAEFGVSHLSQKSRAEDLKAGNTLYSTLVEWSSFTCFNVILSHCLCI